MRNDVEPPTETGDGQARPAAPSHRAGPPLLVLAADDATSCTDELCLPSDARVDGAGAGPEASS